MIKAGIIGATGYAGVELYRILLSHPEVEEIFVSSVSFEGKDITEVYPAFLKIGNKVLLSADGVIEKSEVVFGSLPHGLSQEIAAKCEKKGCVFIDLGADFRLENEETYSIWYNGTFIDKKLHEKAVYGLPELNRAKIVSSKLIANPGCYPTSVALGLYPSIKNGLIDDTGLIIDSKSGTTGAGRGLSQSTHFPDCNEGFAPYKVGAHRHTPEIEQTLSYMAGHEVNVTFVPHLLPVNRGILSTIYADKTTDMSLEGIHKIYCDFYKDEQFVRVLPLGSAANIKCVRMSNYCDISLHEDTHTGKLIIASAIDNMVKGAAGQAIQNMNLVMGFAENCGLQFVPPSF